MTKNEFYERIKEGVLENLKQNDPTLDAIINSVTKINNVVYTGLSFRSDKTNISPVVYLDNFYERFSEDDLSIDEIIEQVTKMYVAHSKDALDINVGSLTSYEAVKDKIVPAICNSDRCKEYLKKAPHESLCDLSVYYRVMIDISDGEGSVLVSSQLMDTWGVTYEELKSQAWSNIKTKNPPVFCSMRDILREMMPAFDDSDFPEETDDSMNILSNQSKQNGAVYLANTSVLLDISSRLESDLIIIPSSRHELIILPFKMADTPDRLSEIKEMVISVNQTTVSAEDYLSDSVYTYLRERGTVEKAA